MILDLVIAGLAIIAIAIGYNRGLIATLLSFIGYVGGGVGGLFLAERYSHSITTAVPTIAIYLFAIFLGANIGRFILGKIGAGIRKTILFGPFKFLDSILGGALSLLQLAIFVVVVLTIARYLPWSLPKNVIDKSEIYARFSNINLLSFQISDLLKSVSLHLDQLKS